MTNSDPKISIISIVVIIVANIIEDKKKDQEKSKAEDRPDN
jgi:hypothetical protein